MRETTADVVQSCHAIDVYDNLLTAPQIRAYVMDERAALRQIASEDWPESLRAVSCGCRIEAFARVALLSSSSSSSLLSLSSPSSSPSLLSLACKAFCSDDSISTSSTARTIPISARRTKGDGCWPIGTLDAA